MIKEKMSQNFEASFCLCKIEERKEESDELNVKIKIFRISRKWVVFFN